MKTKTLLVAMATLLMGGLCFWACQEDEILSGITDMTEHMALKTTQAEPDCLTDCIDSETTEYFKKYDDQTISWGGRHNERFSKTVEIEYYNTLEAFVLRVKSSENMADLLVDGVSVKDFGNPIAAGTWYTIILPLPAGWKACDDYDFEFSVVGNGPPAVFEVEYELIGGCVDCGHNVTFEYNGATVIYGTVLSNGRCWLDRNLGASRVAISSTDTEAYGDLFQWGRAADGHQKRNSGTTSTLSSSDTPGHGSFIPVLNSPWDWRSPQNDNLWQGVNGINNPCPPGYRLPTEAELNAERLSWSSNNSAGAFASPLKLPVAGLRFYSSGSLYSVGSYGYYWSSTVDGIYSRRLAFSSTGAHMYFYPRAHGNSVRCLKD